MGKSFVCWLPSFARRFLLGDCHNFTALSAVGVLFSCFKALQHLTLREENCLDGVCSNVYCFARSLFSHLKMDCVGCEKTYPTIVPQCIMMPVSLAYLPKGRNFGLLLHFSEISLPLNTCKQRNKQNPG